MDSYLEDSAFWSDFQHTFIGCWREAIADVLPETYAARLEETVHLIQIPEEVVKLVYPDGNLTIRMQSAPDDPVDERTQ